MVKGLLLGAGFSFDLGMPLASEFSDILFSFFDAERMTFILNKMRGHRPYSNDRTLCDETLDELIDICNKFFASGKGSYEELFRIIESLPWKSNNSQETRQFFLSHLKSIVNELFLIYQKSTYPCYLLNRDKYEWLLREFADDALWIFTLNHDLLVEMLCLDYNIPLREGYSDIIRIPHSNLNMNDFHEFGRVDATEKSVDGLNYPNSRGVNILKLHGGLNEYFQGDEKSGRKRLFYSIGNCRNSLEYLIKTEAFIRDTHYYINGKKPDISGELCYSDYGGVLQFMQPSILTGSKKYTPTLSSNRHEEKMELFSSGLEKLDELYVIGYSFCDKHINNRIAHAMHLNDSLKLTVVNPACEKQELFEMFDYGVRVRYFRTSFPVWADFEKNKAWDSDFRKKTEEIVFSFRNPMINAIKNNLLARENNNK